jgi:membrane protein
LALLLGPLVFGASLAAISFVAGVSLGFVDEPYWVNTFVIRGLLPFVCMSVLFGLLYWGVPNKVVNTWHAGFGGAMAALGFVGLQKLFTLYIAAGFAMNVVVYGAFSAIPVFLVWLYASWSVILIGALLVAELPNSVSA